MVAMCQVCIGIGFVGTAHSAGLMQEKAEFEARLAEFSVEGQSSKQIQAVADNCLRFGHLEEARGFYEYILENDPDYQYRIWTQTNLIKTQLELWRYYHAARGADKLLIDYSGDANLAKAAEDVAGYFKKHRKFDKALALYKCAIENTEESKRTIWTYEGLAVSSAGVGDVNSCEATKAVLLGNFGENAGLAQIMTNIGHEYREGKNFAKARDCYAYVLENRRTSDAAVWCQMGVALCYAGEGDKEKAGIETDSLITGFAGDKGLANAVYTIAKAYEEKKDFAKAKAVYQKVMNSCPDSTFAAKAQVDIGVCDVLAYLVVGDDDAEGAIDNVASSFGASPYATQRIYEAGLTYVDREERAKAKQVFELIIAEYPACEWAMWSQSKLGILAIADGNDAGGDAAVDKLITNYPDQAEVHKAVYQVGEEYYYKAFSCLYGGDEDEYRSYLTKAKDVWERILKELPERATTRDMIGAVYYSRAVCYRRCGDYQKAIEVNQKVLDEYPRHKYAGSAQYLIGECYGGMAKSGLMGVEEARLKKEDAYKAVAHNHPWCQSYKPSVLKLGAMNYREQDWLDAAMYYEMYLQVCNEHERSARIVYRTGRAYENLGEREAALSFYRDYTVNSEANKFIVKELKRRFSELRGEEE